MRVADLLVSIGIRHASTFESDRVFDLYSLYRRPFSFTADHYRIANGDVRFGFYLSAGARFCEAAPDSFCSVCPPAS
jgi:hypothetical protein